MKKKQKIILALEVFLLAIIMYWNWLTVHYATDTYNIINMGYKEYAISHSLIDGRVLNCIITLLADALHLPIEAFVTITLLIALIISTASVIKLKNILLEGKEVSFKKELLLTFVSFLVIFNFMHIELMYFIEAAVMALSIFFQIYAADYIVNKRSKGKRLVCFIYATSFATLSTFSYQGTIGFLILITFVLSLLKHRDLLENKKIKKYLLNIFIDSILAALASLIALIINLLFVKLVCSILKTNQSRIGKFSDMFDNIKYIFKHSPQILIETCGLFPKYLLYTFVALLTILAFIYDIKTNFKKSLTLKTFAIILVCYICTFLLAINTLTSFYAGRLRFCLGTLIGLILIMWVKENNQNNLFAKIIIAIAIIYGAINIINCIYITGLHKQVNAAEKSEIQTLNNYISKYEKETNIKVTKIVLIMEIGQTDKTYIDPTKVKAVPTYNALRCSWAADGVINFYTNRKLEKIPLTFTLLNKYNEQKNDKGYEIINDTLVVEYYMY